MNKLETAKKIIKDNFNDASCGIFSTRNVVGDYMDTIYDEDGLQIDICYAWAYFEVFGLTDEEFIELKRYYYSLEDE